MSSFLRSVQSRAKDIRESLTPALSDNDAFSKRGVLTPEQFVKAGDELVQSCPTWQWGTSKDVSHTRAYLPPTKQYLVTRGTPSLSRCRGSDFDPSKAMMMDNGDGWMIEDNGKGGEDEFDLCDGDSGVGGNGAKNGGEEVDEKEGTNNNGQQQKVEDNDSDDEYADMGDFNDPTVAPDVSSLAISSVSNGNLRRYDVMISYDKYYQTPRVWLLGYGSDRAPLRGEEMFEDVMEDYVNRTVTIEKFPYTSEVVISIHPCQHGNVMRNIVENMRSGGGEVRVESYMMVFLKFVSSIIPRINYDFTSGVEAATK